LSGAELFFRTHQSLSYSRTSQHFMEPEDSLPCSISNIHFNIILPPQTGSVAHTASYPTVPGTLSQGVKRPGRETDHSPPTSAEVKKTWIYTPTPPCVFMA
ncbi:hypothetical protein B7P43_G00977, partial [Cryptotermes secundus]